jgi:hypothetical protein
MESKRRCLVVRPAQDPIEPYATIAVGWKRCTCGGRRQCGFPNVGFFAHLMHRNRNARESHIPTFARHAYTARRVKVGQV